MYTLAAALDTFEYWSWTSHTNISSRWCKLTVVNLATFVLVLLNVVVAMWLSSLTPFLTSDRSNNVHQCGLYMSADDSDICSSASQSTAPLDPCPVHKHFSRDDRRSLQQTKYCLPVGTRLRLRFRLTTAAQSHSAFHWAVILNTNVSDGLSTAQNVHSYTGYIVEK